MGQESHWDVAFHAIQDAVMILDPEGRIVSCNRATQEMFGVREEEILGRPCWQVIHKIQDPTGKCPTVRARSSLRRERAEIQVGDRWFLADSHPLLDRQGRLTGIVHIVSDITEKKKTEDALSRSEERFRSAMGAARDGIWEWDVPTGKVYYSPAYARMLGYDVGEFGDVVTAWIDHVHPEDRERALEANRRCIDNEVPHFSVEFRMRTKQGGWKWILARGKAVRRDPNGKALLMIGTHTDITQLKLSQEKLLLQSWLGAALANITRVDDVLGWVVEAVVRATGMDCGAAYLWDAQNERLSLFHQVGLPEEWIASMGTLDEASELYRLASPGTPHYIDCGKLNLPRSGNGGAGGLQAVAVVPLSYDRQWVGCLIMGSRSCAEIPEETRHFLESVAAQLGNALGRVETRQRLAESRRQYRTLFDVAADALFVVDQDEGSIMDANQAASKLLGISRGELIGAPWEHVWGGHLDFAQWARDMEAGTTGDSIFAQVTLLNRTGDPVPVEISARSLDLDGHRVLYISARDIRERLQAERERRALEEQLRQAQKMESVGRLAGGIAHDFNNLLTPILGYAEMILASLEGEGPWKSYARSVRDAALKAKSLTGQLLAFSRRQVLEMRPVDLKASVQHFHDLLRRAVREDIQIRLSLPEEPVVVQADLGQMEQVLMNLAVNAQDAMPSGGTLAIELKSRNFLDEAEIPVTGLAPGRYAVLTVADTGTGMDKRTLERIFEPFFTTKGEGKGTGLGLSTVYGIVEQHQGRILATSLPGMGSAFEIYLPQLAGSTACTGPEGTDSCSMVHGKGETILLVEDDDMVRELAFSMLQSLGYHVLEAASPPHALQRSEALRTPPLLLLTDMVLPEMNGKDLYNVLKKRWPDLKVIYMSGYPEEIEAANDHGPGGPAFLSKPFTISQLSRKLSDVLGK
ncbi:PAS domain S-box-containing protein [Desulfacinum hydrothermale DSM 13146]|uniref:histidine kinase n=1 Tax=Desulfacinum hydrothermale DSM 13146 TaxID=1121390 RepID=A0A1W1XDD5_9BACT|nr:PAS domain S-box protein [Desulfacinum hydrothermale]SMC21872.1 PAS domain S-box-containing protein [Desulfacinum hydrothermale DSM 13146]